METMNTVMMYSIQARMACSRIKHHTSQVTGTIIVVLVMLIVLCRVGTLFHIAFKITNRDATRLSNKTIVPVIKCFVTLSNF
jgi:hypothetical protein